MKTHAEQWKPSSAGASVTISAPVKARLSAAQLRFNKLTLRIRKLEKEIEKLTTRLEKLFTAYVRDVAPFAAGYASALYDAAAQLHSFAQNNTLKKSHSESTRTMILDMCERAFRITAPTDSQRTLYDTWRGMTFDDARGDDTHDDGNGERPKRASKPSGRSRPPSVKGKKETAAEFRRASEEALKDRTIRSVYIALAKVLHPDTEVDPRASIEKGELMKHVTVAYAEKDLTALLRLEVEWVQNESRHVDRLSDDTITIYIAALEDQVAVLKDERASCVMQQRYAPVVRLAYEPESAAITALHRQAAGYKDATADLVQFTSILQSRLSPAEILKHMKDHMGK